MLDKKAIDTLAGVSTATITTVLLKKGLRNIWVRGSRPLVPGQKTGTITVSPNNSTVVNNSTVKKKK